MNTDKEAFIRWLTWMRKVSPELYALFKIKHPEIINAIRETTMGFSLDWGSILDTGVKFVQTALPIYQQQQQFKQQLELAKLQIKAPAAFQQQQPQPQQPYAAVAVPPSTPNTSQAPVATASNQQPLVIRIDSSQLPQVKKEAEEVRGGDIEKYLPYIIGGGLLFFALK